ncbi:alpha/beta hydrolase family protein [Aliikangiella sp. IMCC44359]|uniref:alpha/beta hydrolase family protein n=1 Tax=Aliikangiella sp. IMCC44359 TaxID=3459125 RepID=UPI00403AA652
MIKIIKVAIIFIVFANVNANIEAKQTTDGDASSLVPLEVFAKHPKFQNMKISPSGKYLAFTFKEGTEVKLAVMNRKTKKVIAGFADGENRHVVQFDWLNNERISMYFQTITGWLDGTEPNTAWLVANANGKKRKILNKQFSGIELNSRLKSDPKNILVLKRHFGDRGEVKLHKMNIYSGKLKYIADVPESARFSKPGIVDIGVDLNDKVRFAYEYDTGEDKIDDADDTFYLHYKNKKNQWQRLQLDSKHRKPDLWGLGFSLDNKKLYLSSNYDLSYEGTNGVFELNTETGSMKLLYRHDDVDISSSVRGAKNEVIGIRIEPGYPEVQYLDEASNQSEINLLKSLSASFKNQNVSITSRTDDNRLMVLYVRSDINPGEFYLYDNKKKQVTFIGSRLREVEPQKMAKVEPFTLNARDGTKLYGYLTIPKNVEEKNLPLVIFPHGGPYGIKDNWRWDNRAQMLASRGYLVLQLNFRGSGGYSTAFQKAGYGEWGAKMQDDLTDATLWAIKTKLADPNKVCIHGVSYGGYAALNAVVKEPDLYKCAIPDAGTYDLEVQMKKADSFGSNSEAREWYLNRMLGDWKKVIKERSPVYQLEKLKAALLLVHGTEDVRVPIINAYLVEERMKKLGKPYKTLYREDGHGFQNEKYRVELYEEMLSFLQEHIGPGAKPKQ